MRVYSLVIQMLISLLLISALCSGLKPAVVSSDQVSIDKTLVSVGTGKNIPPVAYFEYSPSDPKVGDIVTFDGSKSYDPDGRIVKYRWSYVTAGSSQLPFFMGCGAKIRYSWKQPGSYIVTLEVVDDNGSRDTFQRKIYVDKALVPPHADFCFGPKEPKVGEKVTFDGSKSTDDGSIVKYSWDFGDGKEGEGKVVSHVYSSPGCYLVKLTVVDNDGLESSVTHKIEVEKDENHMENETIADDETTDGGDSVDHHSDDSLANASPNSNMQRDTKTKSKSSTSVAPKETRDESDSKDSSENESAIDLLYPFYDAQQNDDEAVNHEVVNPDYPTITKSSKASTVEHDSEHIPYWIVGLNILSIAFYIIAGKKDWNILRRIGIAKKSRKNSPRRKVEIIEIDLR